MAECQPPFVKVRRVTNPFTKKTRVSTIQKYRRNKNKKLRRKRSKIKYLERLRELRIDRNTNDLCTSVSVVDITDMECAPEQHYADVPTEVTEWQYQHQLAYWKSRAISLEYENRMLHRHIKQMYTEQIEEFVRYTEEQEQIEAGCENDADDGECDKGSGGSNTESPVDEEAKRKEEMVRLYGDMAPKINGMETAMRVGYNLQVDKYNPPYWPNLPLNL